MPAVTDMLATEVLGIPFATPLLNASGAFNAGLFSEMFPLKNVLGGLVTKTVTKDPLAGNPQPRTHELPGIGMLNSIGLQNPGLAYTLEKDIPALKAHGLPVILSLSAHSSREFARMVEWTLHQSNGRLIEAFELNLSCPNVEKGGVHFGSDPASVREAVRAVKSVSARPVFAKLTPNVTDIVSIAGAALEGGSDGLTAINTVLGVAINIKRRKPVMPRVSAGYSGPGIKPVALHAVWNLYKHFPQTPIMAVGGISNAEDALEFIMAGASLMQVGTICFRHPGIFPEIVEDLRGFCQAEGVAHLSELQGCAHG